MDVDYRWWAREAYYIDGNLVDRRWNLSLKGNREFLAGGHTIGIEVAVGPKEYFTRVHVDGKLHVDELFPELWARVEKWKRPPRSYIVSVGIGVASAVIVLWLIGVFRHWVDR